MRSNTTFLGVLETLPSCAHNCAAAAASDLITCAPINKVQLAACLCPNEEQLRKITECVQNSCTYPDWEVMHSAHTRLCEQYPSPLRSGWFRILAVVMIALTLPFIILRIYSRLAITRKYGWDDHTFLISSIFATSTLIDVSSAVSSLGFGTHYWDIDLSNVAPIGILFYVGQIQYVFVQTLSKASIVLFFLRVFTLEKWVRIISKTVLVLLGIKLLVFLFVVIFQCTPIISTWDRSVPGHCVNTKVLTILAGSFCILEDIVILALPIPCIKSLNIGIGKKATTVVMFSIGFIATVISAVRIKFLLDFGARIDTTWEDVDAFAWSVIENSLALICACLPALRPILCLLLPRFFGVFSNSNSKAHTPQRTISSKQKGSIPLDDDGIPLAECRKNWRTDVEARETGVEDETYGSGMKNQWEGSRAVNSPVIISDIAKGFR